MAPRRLLIDTDPGIDDSMAILFALCSPEVEVVGLSTVFSNTDVKQTTLNALRALEVAGHPDIPVASRAAAPFKAGAEKCMAKTAWATPSSRRPSAARSTFPPLNLSPAP